MCVVMLWLVKCRVLLNPTRFCLIPNTTTTNLADTGSGTVCNKKYCIELKHMKVRKKHISTVEKVFFFVISSRIFECKERPLVGNFLRSKC
jgi:hypothetical protein